MHEQLKLIISFDKESKAWNTSVQVLGVEVWLATFTTLEDAERFINGFVDKLKKEALYWTDYEIVRG